MPMAAPTARPSAAPGAFAQRVADADMLVHTSDDPGRDLLEGAEDAAFVGGFAAAAKMLGRSADLVMLDMTDPQRPRARALSAALARIVRARAVNPRFIAGQMRHGPRGAAEFAETVDRLFDFAETTGRGQRANCLICCTTPMSPIPPCATFCCAKIPKPPRRLPSGSTPRAAAASGIRAATMSMPVLRRCARRLAA